MKYGYVRYVISKLKSEINMNITLLFITPSTAKSSFPPVQYQHLRRICSCRHTTAFLTSNDGDARTGPDLSPLSSDGDTRTDPDPLVSVDPLPGTTPDENEKSVWTSYLYPNGYYIYVRSGTYL